MRIMGWNLKLGHYLVLIPILLSVVVVAAEATIRIQGVDLTVVEKATGQDVVDAVIRKIQRSKIFNDDKAFLRRIAYVETEFGQSGSTFDPDTNYGGIWQLNETNYEETKDVSLQKYHLEIQQYIEPSIDWLATTWTDLLKPLYSGLATRLLLAKRLNNDNIPGLLADQANYWANNYNDNPNWDAIYFMNQTEELEADPECDPVIDFSIVMDGSGSIGSQDFARAKQFVHNLVGTFTLPLARIGFIVYEGVSQPRVIFHVENNLTISGMQSLINGTVYLGGGTPTAKGIFAGIYSLGNATIRPNGIPKLLAVFTDGVSDSINDVKLASEAAKNANILTLAIGIGSNINDEELRIITQNETGRIFYQSSYNEMLEFFKRFNSELCSIPQQPGTNDVVFDTLGLNKTRYYKYIFPSSKGLTIKTTTTPGSGNIVGYYSYKEPTPSSAIHEGQIQSLTFIPATYPELYVAIKGVQSATNSYSIQALEGPLDIVCQPGDDLLPDPSNCSLFYQCSNGVPVSMSCACCNLVFNPNVHRCVYAWEYDCSHVPTTTTSTTTTTTEAPSTVQPSTEAPEVSSTLQPSTEAPEVPSTLQPSTEAPEVPSTLQPPTEAPEVPSTLQPSTEAPEVPSTLQPSTEAPEVPSTVQPTTTLPEVPTTAAPTTTTEAVPPCTVHRNPQDCLSSPQNCTFCFDLCNWDDRPRCDTLENLIGAGCQTYDPEDIPDIPDPGTGDPSCNPVIIIPGTKKNITVTFKLEKHPLDLYYLMDFSGSMDDDKDNLVRLSSELVTTLGSLTNDFYLGFGTFVDKPKSPFGDSVRDYSFYNAMPLTSNTDEFVEKVSQATIEDGSDIPESQGDALSQVGSCVEKIGWRGNSRRVVLLATDAEPHVAGDGALGGITAPFQEGCYLDRSGYYTEEVTRDYPSINQLGQILSTNQITTIFAVTADVEPIYTNNIAPIIQPSVVGILNYDSSNIIQLVKDEFESIESRFELERNASSDAVAFKFFSNCNQAGAPEDETVICDHLGSTGEITFIVEIDFAECPDKGSNENGMVIRIGQLGLPIFVEIAIKYLCDINWE